MARLQHTGHGLARPVVRVRVKGLCAWGDTVKSVHGSVRGLLTPVSGVAWEPTVPPLDFEIEAVSEASDRWKGSDQGSWRVTRAVALHRRLFFVLPAGARRRWTRVECCDRGYRKTMRSIT